jgi:hypothetical protein
MSRDITILFPGSFMTTPKLTTLTFEAESRLKSFPDHSFCQCASLCSVDIPKSVRVIECIEVVTVAFESPSSVHTIKSFAFSDCLLHAEITVPSSVLTLEDCVFSCCSELSSVTFEAPSQIVDIPTHLFFDCTLLKTLDLPDSVTRIDGSAFDGSGVTSINGSDCDFLFLRMNKVLCCFGAPSKIIIPSTVREIGERAFEMVDSIEDLSFQEGIASIGTSAFRYCNGIGSVTFPASLEFIEECAFGYSSLSGIAFAVGSRLTYIKKSAFTSCPLKAVALPAIVTEIDPSALADSVWPIVTWDGPPPLRLRWNLMYSPDLRVLFRCFSEVESVIIPGTVQVIGRRAFAHSISPNIEFERGTSLREISEEAFCGCKQLNAFTVPASVETIGDRCFQHCAHLAIIAFEGCSRLKRIGERTFFECGLISITIPVSVQEIDGSAFVNCALLNIQVAGDSEDFGVQRDLLTTADGTKIVRYFGRGRDVTVPKTAEILGKSCFESSNYLESLVFENGSKLRQIGPSAFSGCEFLTTIAIPISVEVIDKSAFSGCHGLEECLLDEDSILLRIGREAFADCRSLSSFCFPKTIGKIDENCFVRCGPLHLLIFRSGESLKKLVDDQTLDEALEHIGFAAISSLFDIEVREEGVDLDFPGRVSVDDSGSTLVLIRSNG